MDSGHFNLMSYRTPGLLAVAVHDLTVEPAKPLPEKAAAPLERIGEPAASAAE